MQVLITSENVRILIFNITLVEFEMNNSYVLPDGQLVFIYAQNILSTVK
jgi:hypothetical protein